MTEREYNQTVLLVSNCRLNENTGRAEKFNTRQELLAERGWELEVSYVEPSLTGLLTGTYSTIRKARSADVVNSVSNPPHLQIAGGIAALATDTPWLAEFRDPLVQNPDVDLNSLAAQLRKYVEGSVIKYADKVVWYDGIQLKDSYFANTYSEVSNVEKIPPIGFEAKKFDSVPPTQFKKFTITYAGSFYDGWIEPYRFFEGFSEYLHKNSNPNVQALFYGDWKEDYDCAVDDLNIGEYIQTHSFVPHNEIVGILKGSDALLYIGGTDPRNKNNIPSKIYDYIGSKKPIIALAGPEFRVSKLIRNYDLGIVIHPENTEGVCEAITQIAKGEFEFNPTDSAEFTRERSTAAYIAALNSIS